MKWTFMFLLALLAGCNSTSYRNVYSSEPRIEWPVHEYNELDKAVGASQVTGQAFLRQRGGGVVTAAGSEVYLNPVTSYSTQFMEAMIFKSHGPAVKLEPELPDPQIYDYLKTTIADAEGKFTFYDVRDGEYYLYTQVFWEVAGSGQGGWVASKITVYSNQINHKILRDADLY